MGTCSPPGLTPARLAALIDHSALRPEATAADIAQACAEARRHGLHAVCVAPVWVGVAVRELDGAARVAAVIGFPHGNTLPEVKAKEARLALDAGARELDMVIQIGALRSGDDELVLRDLHGVAEAAQRHHAVLKVILECALLSHGEKVLGCRLAERAGAQFVKTSTGFGPGGATVEDVALLGQAAAGRLKVKAAGGIRTLAQAQTLLAAGADRLGTSHSVAILRELAAAAAHG